MLQGALDRKGVVSVSSPEKKSTTTASPDKKKKVSKSPVRGTRPDCAKRTAATVGKAVLQAMGM
jgi:hypothetical protein